jgi:hypothetical protein
MKSTGENRQLGEKPIPVPLCPPQISHGPFWDRTPGLRGERLATNRLSHGTTYECGLVHVSLKSLMLRITYLRVYFILTRYLINSYKKQCSV